tara:strand:+ start:520 stop:1077 length:558 start_codon:yes stop_codon:yes gene_type:complete
VGGVGASLASSTKLKLEPKSKLVQFMHLDTRRRNVAGKSDIVTGALEGIIDSFTAAKQLFSAPKQEGDMVKTLREGDISEGQTGVVSKISGDGTVVTVNFPDQGMQYKYFSEDVVPSTGVAEIDMKIEDFYFNNPNANLKQSITPQESERNIYQEMIDESQPTTRASSSEDKLFFPPYLTGGGRK